MATKVNVKDVMAEFMFAESVHRFNELRQEHGQPLLTTTNARNLHDRFMDGFNARLDSSLPANQTENSWATKQQQAHDLFMMDAQKNNIDVYDKSKWTEDMTKMSKSYLGYVGTSASQAFNDAIKDFNNGQEFYQMAFGKDVDPTTLTDSVAFTYQQSRGNISSMINTFEKQTDWDAVLTNEYINNPDKLPLGSDIFVPVSPFDKKYAFNKTILDRGAAIHWAVSEKLIDNDGNFIGPDNKPERMQDIILYASKYQKAETAVNVIAGIGANNKPFGQRVQVETSDVTVNPKYEAGKLYTYEDACGLSALRPYMSNADYKSVAEPISSFYARNASDPKKGPMSDEAIKKSIKILEWLTDNGYEYSISKDSNPGQLKAHIGNSKIDIRIMDTAANENYIGRCYNDGMSGYYQKGSQKTGYGSATTEDTIRLISYMMGNTVERTHYNAGPEWTPKLGQNGVRRQADDVAPVAGGKAALFRAKTGTGQNIVIHEDGIMDMSLSRKQGMDRPDQQVLMDVELGAKAPSGTYHYRNKKLAIIESVYHNKREYFETPTEAIEYLTDAIESARNNYTEKMNLDGLINQYHEHENDTEYQPVLSPDPNIAPVQSIYWDVLSGKRDLFKAGTTWEDAMTEVQGEKEGLADIFKGLGMSSRYEGTHEEQVKQHFAESLDLEIGTIDLNPDDNKRFNPDMVASLMNSASGKFRNTDDIIAAMNVCNMDASECRGNDFAVGQIKDKLLKFDETTSHNLGDSPFMSRIEQTIKDTLASSHAVLAKPDGDKNPIQIDDNGVIHYNALRGILKPTKGSKKAEDLELVMEEFSGTIGQVFEPDEDGLVETKYNGSENKLFVPAYKATILPQKDGEFKNMIERTRLVDYTRIVCDNIKAQIRSDVVDMHPEVGTTTSINNSYKGLYMTRLPITVMQLEGESLKDTYLRQCEQTGLPSDIVKAQFETFAGQVKYPSDLKESSSLNAAFAHNNREVKDVDVLANDNGIDGWNLTGHTNMSVLGPEGDGYFDKNATGSAKNQGNVRYLVQGAVVREDGSIIPAMKENEHGEFEIDKDAQTALMATEIMKYSEFTPYDRKQMVFSNLQSATGVAFNTGVACLTVGGNTFDDGVPITSKWAAEHGVIEHIPATDTEPAHDTIRPLGVGDKILDPAGNKCVVGMVVDLDKPDEEIAKMSKAKQAVYQYFKENPEVDIVMSPYAPMGRFNATSAKWAMDSTFATTLPDGREVYGGHMPIIITDKTADEKTKVYDDEAIKTGGGRSASGQFNWVLSAKNAYGLMDECYGGNGTALSSYREYLITMGLDMSETGQLRMGYEPQQGEERHLFTLPSPNEVQSKSDKDNKQDFRNLIDARGGFLEVPFQMTLPSGAQLQEIPREQSAYKDRTTYALPILSSYLRSGQEFQDGSSMVHDYTNQYTNIYANSVKYMSLTEAGAPEDEKAKKKFETELYKCQSSVAESYTSITSDIKNRIFEGKHNFIRDHIMSARLPHSATAVWSAEPDAKLDEIWMNETMAKNLGKSEGDMVAMWRDPCLHTRALTGMKVHIDNSLTGIAVNPFMASRMDGDFDGDSVGLYGVSSKAGLADLNNHFALHNTLLDPIHKDVNLRDRNGEFIVDENEPDGIKKGYRIAINTKMDITSALLADENARKQAEFDGNPIESKSFKEQFNDIQNELNLVSLEKEGLKKMLSGEKLDEQLAEIDKKNQALCDNLSQWTKDLMDTYPIGTAVLDMKNPQTYLESLNEIAASGAKGKPGAVLNTAKQAGYEVETEVREDGKVWAKPETVIVHDKTLTTRKDEMDVEMALAIKSSGTGLAGQVSLNLAAVARNLCLKDGLDLTYNATQGILQSKHDAAIGIQQYTMLNGALREMWRGHKVEHVDTAPDAPISEHWRVVKDDKGKSVQLTTDEWVNQFMEIHNAKDGMNLAGDVNVEQVKLVANALTSPDGTVYDITSKEALMALAAPMDRLGYGKATFDKVVEAAKNNENLFEGEANFHLAPAAVRRNITKMAEYEKAQLEKAQILEATQEAVKSTPDVKGIQFEPTPDLAKTVNKSVEQKIEKPVLETITKSDTKDDIDTHKENTSERVQSNKRGSINVMVNNYHAKAAQKADSDLIDTPKADEIAIESVAKSKTDVDTQLKLAERSEAESKKKASKEMTGSVKSDMTNQKTSVEDIKSVSEKEAKSDCQP